jgi:hypothetical protein
LPVIKHPQLALQVGAFGEFTLEGPMDFGNMIFLVGLTFIFGSWICVANDDGRLQSQLTEILPPQHTFTAPAIVTDQLVEKLSQLLIFGPTQILKIPKEINSDSTTPEEINPESNMGSTPKVPGPYPLGLRNTAFTYQDSNQGRVNPV